jgi:hypothetical protein
LDITLLDFYLKKDINMTEEQLKEIEDRANAATPGPWVQHGRYVRKNHVREIVIQGSFLKKDGVNSLPVIDAEFIAHARTDIPALIAEVREQKEQIKTLVEALEWIASDEYKVAPSHWDAIAKEQSTVARVALKEFRGEK